MPSLQIHGQEIAFEGHEEFWQQASRGEWEPFSFDVLKKHIVPGQIFVDIGAWIGILSLYACKLGARVVAFEPDEVACNEFEDNIEVNDISPSIYAGIGIDAYNFAITDQEGSVELHTTDEFGKSISSIIQRNADNKSESVYCRRLDDTMRNGWPNEKICLIKMDIEGGEAIVIPSISKWLSEVKPKLYISFHPAWLPISDQIKIIDTLFPIYKCFGVINGEKEYDIQDFLEAMQTPHDHSFLFIPR